MSIIYLVTKGEVEYGMVVDSVEIVMLSLDPDCVFAEGDIMSNKVFVGIVYCSEFNRRTESW